MDVREQTLSLPAVCVIGNRHSPDYIYYYCAYSSVPNKIPALELYVDPRSSTVSSPISACEGLGGIRRIDAVVTARSIEYDRRWDERNVAPPY